jgi:hypothetical protein
MNQTLIKILNALNKLLALIIILVGIFSGLSMSNYRGAIYLVLGVLGGFIAAALICGTLALLIEIESHLRKLAGKPTAE